MRFGIRDYVLARLKQSTEPSSVAFYLQGQGALTARPAGVMAGYLKQSGRTLSTVITNSAGGPIAVAAAAGSKHGKAADNIWFALDHFSACFRRDSIYSPATARLMRTLVPGAGIVQEHFRQARRSAATTMAIIDDTFRHIMPMWQMFMPKSTLGPIPLYGYVMERPDLFPALTHEHPSVIVGVTPLARYGDGSGAVGDGHTLNHIGHHHQQRVMAASATLRHFDPFDISEQRDELHLDGGYTRNPKLADFVEDCIASNTVVVCCLANPLDARWQDETVRGSDDADRALIHRNTLMDVLYMQERLGPHNLLKLYAPPEMHAETDPALPMECLWDKAGVEGLYLEGFAGGRALAHADSAATATATLHDVAAILRSTDHLEKAHRTLAARPAHRLHDAAHN